MNKSNDWQLYKRLLAYVVPYKAPIFFSLIGFILYASAAPMLAHMISLLEDALSNPTPESRLLIPVALIAIFSVRGAGTFLSGYFMDVISRNVVHRLRLDIFSKLLNVPNTYYDERPGGQLVSQMTYDVEQVSGATSKAISDAIRESLVVIGLFGYMLFISWKLTITFILVAPLIGLVVGAASRYFRKYSKRIQSSMGGVTQIVGETVGGIREIKAFGGQDYETDRFSAASKYNKVQSLKFARVNHISTPIIQILVASALSFLVWLALGPEFLSHMEPGEFMAYFVAASTLAKPLKTLTKVNSVIQKGLAAATSIFGLLDERVELDEGNEILDSVTGRIEFKDVSFNYEGAETVVNDVSFIAEPGEVIALVGRSGSGKTTLVNLLSRFYNHKKGAILIDGKPIEGFSLLSLRQQMSMVGQNVTLFNDSVRNNIAYASLRDTDDATIISAAKAAHATEFVNEMPDGFDTQIGDDGVLLSGGQRQRLAIARAILKDAPILVLDEATSALDTESERYIQDALEKVMKGRTTFVIAHRLSTIESADKILVMDKGVIVEQGSHAELIKKDGYYAQLHKMQFKD
jgi:subfamily B ATP-binding cassette protein MsbA